MNVCMHAIVSMYVCVFGFFLDYSSNKKFSKSTLKCLVQFWMTIIIHALSTVDNVAQNDRDH